MRAYERFMKYIGFDTASDENSPSCPSTEGQLILGRELVREMLEMGISDARMDKDGYVYGSIPENRAGMPVIGLIAHMDTVSGVPCMPMKARIIKNYDGRDIVLDEAGKNVLRLSDFEHMHAAIGKDLIVTDGNTILGADDKAGIAEILTACEALLSDPNIPHGKVAIAFTPDEEIGRGADRFDVAGFGADFAYTVDGGAVAGIEYENFNAAGANLLFHGLSIHTGSAKNKLRNAALIAMEFHGMLPPFESPEHTEGYEGFYHLDEMEGDVETARLKYLIRDHDMDAFKARKAYMHRAAQYLNDKYGPGTIELVIKDSYYNMKNCFEGRMHIVEGAVAAMRKAGYEPVVEAIRGGTDGSRLSYMGLPCPNISTGGMNAHGRFECVAVQDMDEMVRIILNILSPDEM